MRKGIYLLAGIAMLVALALTPGISFAATTHTQAHHSPHLFVSQKHGQKTQGVHNAATSSVDTTFSNMTYDTTNHGPVMGGTAHVYAIFWEPTHNVSANYNSLITRYFNDVGSSSFYQIAAQYKDSLGNFPQGSTLAGAWVDNGAYPAEAGMTGTVLDSDIENEVTHAQQVNGWTSSIDNVFFVFLEKNEGLCFKDNTGAVAACTPGSPYSPDPNAGFCAYHSYFGANTLYAAMPYAASPNFGGDCTPWAPFASSPAGSSPNNDDADLTINVTSHEQMEAATDPLLNAWYDANGNEIGDKCAWLFGPNDTTGADASLNGNGYILQQEWNNAISGCSLVPSPTPQTYQLQNNMSGLLVDVSGASTSAGAQIIQWGYNGGQNQMWRFIPYGPFYQIQNVHSGLYLDDPGFSTTAGTNLTQAANDNNYDEMWYLVPDGINDQIVNIWSDLVVDVANGGANFGGSIIQYTSHNGYNQMWEFKSYPPITSFYEFQNHNSGLVADVSGGSSTMGGQLIQYTNHNGANQQWIILPAGTHNGTPIYQIMNRNSGLIMDVNGASDSAGASIIQWAQHSGLNQMWEFLPSLSSCQTAGNYCQIENVNSGLVIDVSGGSTAVGASLVQEPSSNATSQQWTLVAVAP